MSDATTKLFEHVIKNAVDAAVEKRDRQVVAYLRASASHIIICNAEDAACRDILESVAEEIEAGDHVPEPPHD